MPKAKQLTVLCENRPGTLAQVAKVLGDAKVNILAFVTATAGTEGSVRIVVDNVNKAKKALDGGPLVLRGKCAPYGAVQCAGSIGELCWKIGRQGN